MGRGFRDPSWSNRNDVNKSSCCTLLQVRDFMQVLGCELLQLQVGLPFVRARAEHLGWRGIYLYSNLGLAERWSYGLRRMSGACLSQFASSSHQQQADGRCVGGMDFAARLADPQASYESCRRRR